MKLSSHPTEAEILELHQENQLRADFLSMTVHQLRTSLTAAKWIFKMMLDGDLGALTDEQRMMMSRGFDNNEHMIRMLAEISNANHLSEWKMHIVKKPTNVQEILHTLISTFQAEAKSKNITIACVPHENIPLLSIDSEKIIIVFQNILENGIKYNHPSGILTIQAEQRKDQVIISFTDTGIGIPLDDQKYIFSKFYRAENAKLVEKGTGLGLYVAKEIIESHNGTIWFESIENHGSTFFVSLPV